VVTKPALTYIQVMACSSREVGFWSSDPAKHVLLSSDGAAGVTLKEASHGPLALLSSASNTEPEHEEYSEHELTRCQA